VRLAFIQLVDGAPVGQGDLLVTILAVARPVGQRLRRLGRRSAGYDDYKPPFAFPGTVKKLWWI
jgi:hypothetical protein